MPTKCHLRESWAWVFSSGILRARGATRFLFQECPQSNIRVSKGEGEVSLRLLCERLRGGNVPILLYRVSLLHDWVPELTSYPRGCRCELPWASSWL